MKKLWAVCFAGFCALISNARVEADDWSLAVVRHHWIAKIVESNYVTIRPGSVYDMQTYFEQNFGLFQPKFNYLFNDTGLGTADPIYPIYQKGYQQSWFQLIGALLSEHNRHIDHYSALPTPEGCLVEAAYFVRHIDEFPDMYQEERAQGYTLVDIGFDYYTKLKPDAECGRHRSNAPNPKFDPMKFIKKYAKKFRTGADVPAEQLKKFEFKIGLLKLVKEEFGQGNHPRFKDLYTPERNSMWYYPNGIPAHFGFNTPRPQPGLDHLKLPQHLIFEATPSLQNSLPLDRLLSESDFQKYLNFLHGKPVPNYQINSEPGKDALDIRQITSRNFYSRGLNVLPMPHVEDDVSNPRHYKLVAAILRPFEDEKDIHFLESEAIPQVRFVYQLMDSDNPDLPMEQLYVHLMFDAVDRLAPADVREQQHREFLRDLDTLTQIRENGRDHSAEELAFIEKYTARGIQSMSFSSSLTGIWVFGMLTRSFSTNGELEALRIIRNGVDVGYYSTAWDNELFRKLAERSSPARKAELLQQVDDITPQTYRDPRRMDVRKINFNRMTCAQCHQMTGRDAVHVAFNDHIDRRITSPIRTSEFLYHELDRQLQESPWLEMKSYLQKAFQ